MKWEVEMWTGAATLENFVEDCQRKLKIELPYEQAIELLGIYTKDTDAEKHLNTCPPMFIAAMSTIAKLWKEPLCPSKDEWIKKLWSRYTMEYYSAFRNDKYPTLVSFFLRFYFIYSWEIQSKRKRQRHRQKEKQVPCREPEIGLDPGSSRSRHGLQAALNPCATGPAPTFGFDMDGTGGCYVEWNKSIREGQTLYGLIHLGNIKNSERE